MGAMEDGKTSVSKEELEKVQSQVNMGLSELGGEGTAAGRGIVVLLPRCGRHCPRPLTSLYTPGGEVGAWGLGGRDVI